MASLRAAVAHVQGKTVEDIISQWDMELEKRSRAFMGHAVALADWDRAILGNRESLLTVEEQLRKVPLSATFFRVLGFSDANLIDSTRMMEETRKMEGSPI